MGIWIKHFKRTAVVQEFLLIKSYERLFGAMCNTCFFANRLHFEPFMFSKGPFSCSLTLAAAAVRQHSNLFNFNFPTAAGSKDWNASKGGRADESVARFKKGKSEWERTKGNTG